MSLRFFCGAMNWPFVPTTVNIGSDIQWRSALNPQEYPNKSKIPMVADPFTGREYGALSPLKPEMASIHVPMADVEGNAIILGTEWGRFELARAAKKVVLVADHIVDASAMRQFPNMVRINDFLVEAVVPWAFCCWPACSNGLYDSDEEHYKMMNKMLASEEGTVEYMEKYVNSWSTQEEFLHVIGQGQIEKLSKNISTAHLMDPFRQYVKSQDQVMRLMEESIYANVS
jgi:glutaconate CoA-transferase subunit A